MQRRRFIGLVTAALSIGLLAMTEGCGQSKAVGTWKGRVSGGGMLGQLAAASGAGEATVTLKKDGTGFAKTSIAPEQPITWEEKDGKVVMKAEGGKPDPNSGSLVGTLSEDGRTMQVDLGPLKIDLAKQEGK